MSKLNAKTMMKLKFNDSPKRWKYQVEDEFTYCLGKGFSAIEIQTLHFEIVASILVAYVGYSWDGASGPTIDTETSMRASLVHDILYQCIEEGLLPYEFRKRADKEFRKICLADGMGRFRAWYYYRVLRLFGGIHLKRRKLK